MRRRTRVVVAVMCIECRQIEIVDQMMHRMGERTRYQLRGKIHRQQPRTQINMPITCHARALLSALAHWSKIDGVFLQLR